MLKNVEYLCSEMTLIKLIIITNDVAERIVVMMVMPDIYLALFKALPTMAMRNDPFFVLFAVCAKKVSHPLQRKMLTGTIAAEICVHIYVIINGMVTLWRD